MRPLPQIAARWIWLRFVPLPLLLAGCQGLDAGPGLPPDDGSPGRQLYVTKCAKCHKFYNPANYSDEDWQKWMAKMSKKSKLTAEQSELLSKYIEENLRKRPAP